jgi:hypothetical protein
LSALTLVLAFFSSSNLITSQSSFSLIIPEAALCKIDQLYSLISLTFPPLSISNLGISKLFCSAAKCRGVLPSESLALGLALLPRSLVTVSF